MPHPDDLVLLGVSGADVALWITDPSGQLRYANDKFTELFGWSADDDVHISRVAPEEDRAFLATYVSRIVAGDVDEFRTVKRFVRKDGSDFHGSAVLRPMCDGGQCVGLVGHVVPSERRELVGDRRVAKLLEFGSSSLTLVDESGRVTETAGRYRPTLGYPSEFWDDRSVFDVVVPEDGARVLAQSARILEQPDEPITTDVSVVDALGEVQVLEVTAVNLLDDPDVRGIVVTSRNVTDERATWAHLESMRDQAIAEAEARSRLIATVSHELRNPLHAIAGLSELLSSDEALDSPRRSIAQTLHRQVTQMARVTDDLLEHTRLALGAGQIRLAPTRVRDLVNDVAELAHSAIGDRPLSLNVHIDSAVPSVVTTDGSRTHQVLWNLVENAIKFTETGRIDVSVACVERIGDQCQLRVSVTDTGPGIDSDELARIFDPFHTTAPVAGRNGMGLGLAITKRILEMLDGTIEVTTGVGRGTTFRIRIPGVVVADEPVAPLQEQEWVDAVERPVVMVIEDNEVNQELARYQLERLGMVPVIVGSAEQALEMVGDQAVDAILMDHQLPGMNGRDATRRIRGLGVVAPIIGVTASATAADESACLDAGMDAFLAKPVGLAQLRTTLRQFVEHDRSVATGNPDLAPAATDGSSGQVVDTRALDELARELGDSAIVASLVATFLGELDLRRGDIASADADAAARQAHSLKSGARMLGAFLLAEACAGLEDGRVDIQTVVEHTVAAETALHAWLAGQPDGHRS